MLKCNLFIFPGIRAALHEIVIVFYHLYIESVKLEIIIRFYEVTNDISPVVWINLVTLKNAQCAISSLLELLGSF